MKASVFFALMLLGCGPLPQIPDSVSISLADEQSTAPLESLMADLAALGYPNILVYGTPGYTITVNVAKLSEYNLERGTCAAGVHYKDAQVIFLASTEEWFSCVRESTTVRLSPEGQKRVLAHELGHALLGPTHTAHGLMAAGCSECLHREAQCIIEALLTKNAIK